MPITLPPLSRRRFLKALAGAAALPMLPTWAWGVDAELDPDQFILLSDVHIAADPAMKRSGESMSDHLQSAIEQMIASNLRPASSFITGDLAFSAGLPEDYATLLTLVKPLRETGTSLHLALGNHDNFAAFSQSMVEDVETVEAVASKQVAVIETPRANFFMLDSLEKTLQTPGRLGPIQLKWLGEALDQRPTKPAIVLLHHNPIPVILPSSRPAASQPASTQPAKPLSLLDKEEFLAVLAPRKQVKAVMFGHTHRYSIEKYEGIHLVNLPAVAYAFSGGAFLGWCDLRLADRSGVLTIHPLNAKDAKRADKLTLDWRA